MIRSEAFPAEVRFKGRIFVVRRFPSATAVYSRSGDVWLRAYPGGLFEYNEQIGVPQDYAEPGGDDAAWLRADVGEAAGEAEVPWVRVSGEQLPTSVWVSRGEDGETIIRYGQAGEAWGESVHQRDRNGYIRWDPAHAGNLLPEA